LDSGPLNITSFGKAILIKGSTIYRWYRDVLSSYARDGGESVHKNDVGTGNPGNRKTISVPIFEEANFGQKMAVDEKHIGEDFYTIISNRETGKIAMLCNSIKFIELHRVLSSHPAVLTKVKSISRDFSSLYKKLCDQIFPGAIQVGDKFHVIRQLMEAHQAIRIKYRQKELEKRRLALNEFKKSEKLRMQVCEHRGEIFKPRKFSYREQRLENGETPLELLARSRYLLFKFQSQWTPKQQVRANVLFGLYPEIEQAYHLSCQFRNFMSKKNIGRHYLQTDKELHQWYQDAEDADIDEILNFKAMVESNEEYVVNYFIRGETNALAEGINSKIQKFISSNQGTRDRDFFFFRIAKYFS
jgi:transposase